VRYGGNTSCVAVRLANNELVVLDCGTGARNLGLQLLTGPFGQGQGRATFLLSHAHWDHIQGFPFFGPSTWPATPSPSTAAIAARLLRRSGGQMAAQYFPVQTIKNMGAQIEMRAVVPASPSRSTAPPCARTPTRTAPPRPSPSASRTPAGAGLRQRRRLRPGRSLGEAIALCQDADLLIHDSTFTPEDRALRIARGLSSLEDAVECAVRAGVKKLALFHYDQDYSDRQVDQLVAIGTPRCSTRGAPRPSRFVGPPRD
jgi:phosphoribosyl 1,2-cyclic phosphodiesterase